MHERKALSIVSLVEKSLTLNPLGTIKIEFGNSQFDTRQMYPGQFIIEGNNLIVDLVPDIMQCKAISRGESCGTTGSGDQCCAPATQTEKPKLKMVNLANTTASCEPGSGCC